MIDLVNVPFLFLGSLILFKRWMYTVKILSLIFNKKKLADLLIKREK